jgi:hypothetical protein
MVSSYVRMSELRVGLPVEYLGETDATVILSETLRATGMALYTGHPGRIWSTTIQHVQVTWVGLEDEPASYAVGFSIPDSGEHIYAGLGLITDAEFERRAGALRDSLASGEKLSKSVPPWTPGPHQAQPRGGW